MALMPLNEAHALQIQAGALGRKAGHGFEDKITDEINHLGYPMAAPAMPAGHVFQGDPALTLLGYIASREGYGTIVEASAISTGALATSEEGKRWLSVNGVKVTKCKSDVVLTLTGACGTKRTFGVSIKQCNNAKPTNAQLYFTTAVGFTNLLRNNGIPVSDRALYALRQFCGDTEFRPQDINPGQVRLVDPRRYFWEEIDPVGRAEWEANFSENQDAISRLLLQKAYIDDPFVPDYVLHKTKSATGWNATEVAIYSIEELLALSRSYQGFATRPYSVRKGSYVDPAGVMHLAPRFGVIQMQRGGQAQHPTQLQFNLEAGYFYKIC